MLPAARPRVVDLSHPVEGGMPVYPGDPPVALTPARTRARDGADVLHLHLGSHTGTHVDAPSHVVEGGARLDELPLGLFVGPARVVDLRDLGPREGIDFERLAAYARPDRMLVLHTGWSRHWGTPAYADHPFLTGDAARQLVEAGVRTVGIDAFSVDETGGEAFPAHEALLGSGGVLVENLTGLDALGVDEAFLSVLPLRLREGDGSPVRAVALLPEQGSGPAADAPSPLREIAGAAR